MLAGLIALIANPPASDAHWTHEAINLHDALSDRPYVVEPAQPLPVASSDGERLFGAPDLTESRLYLVAAIAMPAQSTADIALHYRGLNGCRLTIAAFPARGPAGPSLPVAGVLRRTWTIAGTGFAVVATGMEPHRFDTAARYAEAEIRKQIRRLPGLRTAMRTAAAAAPPCV